MVHRVRDLKYVTGARLTKSVKYLNFNSETAHTNVTQTQISIFSSECLIFTEIQGFSSVSKFMYYTGNIDIHVTGIHITCICEIRIAWSMVNHMSCIVDVHMTCSIDIQIMCIVHSLS